jgi:hypothetical protein
LELVSFCIVKRWAQIMVAPLIEQNSSMCTLTLGAKAKARSARSTSAPDTERLIGG